MAYSVPLQPKELRTRSGEPETIQTLEYGYLLVNTAGGVLIGGRDGRTSLEFVPVDMVPGLREFVTPIVSMVLGDPANPKLLHYQPHDDGREMKVSAKIDRQAANGHYWIHIIALPLDFPLDIEGQRNYDTTAFEAGIQARSAVRH